jgi:hypothetical protein
LSIVIRYVTNDLNDGPKIRERFLGFIPLERTNSETIFLALTNKLKSLGLSFENMVSQCYDGTNSMSGDKSGLQKRIKDVCPSAFYIHCSAHNLNLALVNALEAVEKDPTTQPHV